MSTASVQLRRAPKIKLNNGYEMPVLGLGTFELKKSKCETAVRYALELGYRHIDTAYLYCNEASIGTVLNEAIDNGLVQRDEVLLVTKLWDSYHEPERVHYACQLQLKLLGLQYIDIYLMHTPFGTKYINDTELPQNFDGLPEINDVDFVDTYKAMEKLVDLGLVRSLGVSNFNIAQLKRLLQNCRIKPVTNQVECHFYFNQLPLIEYCRANDIVVTAYSPLGRPRPHKPMPEYFNDDEVLTIAEKYHKTPVQVALRYLIDIGTVPIPKSSQSAHLRENFDVFDFSLTSDEVQELHTLNRNMRIWNLANIQD